MNMIRRIAVAVLTLAVAVAAQAAKPIVSFSASSVTVSEVAPGHDVLIFSIAREAGRYFATQVRREIVLSPAPGMHSVTWDIGKPVPPKSVWCAIDLQTADTTLASPPELPLQHMTSAPLFPRDAVGALAAIAHERADVFVLVATPGRGVWIVRTGDGGSNDSDTAVGKSATFFTHLESIQKNGPPAPRVLTPKDVVILIDTMYLDAWSGQVGVEVQP